MNKKSLLYINDRLPVVCEDVYVCRYMIEGNRIRISSFPWKVKALSSDLKKDKTDIE